MDPDQRRWLETLAEAVRGSLTELRALDGLRHGELLEDLDNLLEKLTGELETPE